VDEVRDSSAQDSSADEWTNGCATASKHESLPRTKKSEGCALSQNLWRPWKN
jgi:hypothetical protein